MKFLCCNVHGDGRFSPGQGKGFPEATPLPSVGSVNRFSRRAIARGNSRGIGF